jgi:hypothetical protein
MNYLVKVSAISALIFHALFGCLYLFAPFEGKLLSDSIFVTVLNVIFVALVILCLWILINAFIVQFQFQSEYGKQANTSEQESLVILVLFFGGLMSEECERLRREYLCFLKTLFFIAIPWGTVFYVAQKVT